VAGSDLLASARTGTGKTTGFVLPLFEHVVTGFEPDRHAAEQRPRNKSSQAKRPQQCGRELASRVHALTDVTAYAHRGKRPIFLLRNFYHGNRHR